MRDSLFILWQQGAHQHWSSDSHLGARVGVLMFRVCHLPAVIDLRWMDTLWNEGFSQARLNSCWASRVTSEGKPIKRLSRSISRSYRWNRWGSCVQFPPHLELIYRHSGQQTRTASIYLSVFCRNHKHGKTAEHSPPGKPENITYLHPGLLLFIAQYFVRSILAEQRVSRRNMRCPLSVVRDTFFIVHYCSTFCAHLQNSSRLRMGVFFWWNLQDPHFRVFCTNTSLTTTSATLAFLMLKSPQQKDHNFLVRPKQFSGFSFERTSWSRSLCWTCRLQQMLCPLMLSGLGNMFVFVQKNEKKKKRHHSKHQHKRLILVWWKLKIKLEKGCFMVFLLTV